MAPERKDLPGEIRDFTVDVRKELRTTAVKETSKGIVKGILWGLALIAAVLAFVVTGLSDRSIGILWGFALSGLANLLLEGFRRLYLHQVKGREVTVIENESAAINRIREACPTCIAPVRYAYGYVNRVCRSEEAIGKDAGPKAAIADLIRMEILPCCKDALDQLDAKLKEPGITVADREKLFRLFGVVMYSAYFKLTRAIRVQLSCILGFERVFQSPEYRDLQRLDSLMHDEMRKLWDNWETRPAVDYWCIGGMNGQLDVPAPLVKPSEDPPPSTASEQAPPSSRESS
jgi:hypothetical protein